MERARFWSRVGHWFTGADKAAVSAQHTPPTVPQEAQPAAPAGPESEGAAQTAEGGTGQAPRARPTRGGQNPARVEEQTDRLARSIDELRTHLTAEAGNRERIAQVLDTVAAGLANAPDAATKQLESLTALREATAEQLVCLKRIEESLSQLPQIADAQRETMVSVARQLDLAREASEKAASTNAQCKEVLDRLGEATNASTKTLQEMRWDVSARDAQISSLLSEHTRRFTWFAWSAIGVATVAAILGLVALFV